MKLEQRQYAQRYERGGPTGNGPQRQFEYGGTIKLFGRDYKDADVRAKAGVLIEASGCFPNDSVWNNMMLQAANLSIPNAKAEVQKALEMVRMEGAAGNKYKNCSLGMKQRIGIAMALLGHPVLLVLGEPVNGLDADGMRLMKEILVDITKKLRVRRHRVLLFFMAAVLVCIFVTDDFRSGYAKNLFAVRPRKTDYVISKTLVDSWAEHL